MIDKNVSLKEQTYNTIREMIISLKLGFGEKINIAELSRTLQVSNTPIREALSRLESGGLVVNSPNIGPSVVTMSLSLFQILTQTITVLMTGSYLECVTMGSTDKLVKILTARLASQQELYSHGLTLEYAATAIAFDRSFVDACDNHILTTMFASSFDLLMMATYYIHKKRPQATANNLREHERLLDAVKAGAHEDVYHLIFSHIHKQEYVEYENPYLF